MNTFYDDRNFGKSVVPFNHMPVQAGLIELCFKHPCRNTLLLPGSFAVELLQPRAGDDPVDTLTTSAAKMQCFAIDLIDNQIRWWNRQVAMGTSVRSGHGLQVEQQLAVQACTIPFKFEVRIDGAGQFGCEFQLINPFGDFL